MSHVYTHSGELAIALRPIPFSVVVSREVVYRRSVAMAKQLLGRKEVKIHWPMRSIPLKIMRNFTIGKLQI